MATKAKTHPYVVMYNDNSNIIYELTQANYDKLSHALAEGKKGVVIPDIGVLVLDDIRAVVKQRIEIQAPPESADPVLTDEEKAWVHQYREMIKTAEEGGYQ